MAKDRPGPIPDTSDEDIIDAIRSGDTPVMTTRQVADALPISRRAVSNRLNRLHDEGRIENMDVGSKARVWWVDDDGDEHFLPLEYERCRCIEKVLRRPETNPTYPRDDTVELVAERYGFDPDTVDHDIGVLIERGYIEEIESVPDLPDGLLNKFKRVTERQDLN